MNIHRQANLKFNKEMEAHNIQENMVPEWLLLDGLSVSQAKHFNLSDAFLAKQVSHSQSETGNPLVS